MKRRSVQRAYQNIRPDEEAKQRMLNNILLSSEIPSAGKDERNMRKKMKPMVIAAIITLMVMLMGCAIVAMSLQDLKIGEHTYKEEAHIDDFGNYIGETEFVRDVISLQGIKDSPNQKAAQEWLDFIKEYDPDGEILKSVSHEDEKKIPEEYSSYNCYTKEMMDKVDEICNKYKLNKQGPSMEAHSEEEFYQTFGIERIIKKNAPAESVINPQYYYQSGTFMLSCETTLTGENVPWVYPLSYQFYCVMKTDFDDVTLNIGDTEDYEQWIYTTTDGVDVLLAISPDKALMLVDKEEYFISINILNPRVGDILYGELRISPEAMEQFADIFDFSFCPQALSDAEWEALKQSEENRPVKPTTSIYSSFEDYIAYQIAKLEDKATEMYYHLTDLNDDGEEDLILGSENEIDTVWMMIDGTVQLIVDYGENYQKLKEAWPSMDKKPITEYGVTSTNQDKYGYQRYIDEVLSMEHPENTLFVLSDINDDGTVELLIGDREILSYVFRVNYSKNGYANIEVLSASMTEDELNALKEAWSDMDRKPVTEYYSG